MTKEKTDQSKSRRRSIEKMKSDLADKYLVLRFASVNIFGTIADYFLAVFLTEIYGFARVAASTLGFILGTIINYCGHSIFSYEHTSINSISFLGYGKFLLAVSASLVVRLAVVVALGYVTALPFWFILLCAIGASFLVGYVISTLLVFKKTD